MLTLKSVFSFLINFIFTFPLSFAEADPSQAERVGRKKNTTLIFHKHVFEYPTGYSKRIQVRIISDKNILPGSCRPPPFDNLSLLLYLLRAFITLFADLKLFPYRFNSAAEKVCFPSLPSINDNIPIFYNRYHCSLVFRAFKATI